jgi:malate synthase
MGYSLFYLPKIEHYQERWWNEVFEFAENYLNVAVGTFKQLYDRDHNC